MSDETNKATLSDPELAALAQGMLLLDDARLYGFIEGGPNVDREQCSAVLDRLAREGVVPSDEDQRWWISLRPAAGGRRTDLTESFLVQRYEKVAADDA